jgi:hypothetical protein
MLMRGHRESLSMSANLSNPSQSWQSRTILAEIAQVGGHLQKLPEMPALIDNRNDSRLSKLTKRR